MHTFLADIRFGVRMLLKSPLMTFIALLALTLGIGANTAIFSVVNAVLLRTFPYTDAESLVLVWEKRQGARTDQNVINLGNFSDWKDQNQVFSDMAVFFDRNFNLTSDGEPEEVVGQFGTTNLFSVLGTNAALGRTFVAEDGREGQPRVMPANFGWHIQRGTQASKPADIWVPLQISNELRRRRGRFASAVARLKPGVSRDQAQREFDTIGARLAQQYPEFNTNWGVNVVPLRTQVRSLFVVTQVALALVLLVGAGLLLKSFNRLQSVDPGFNPGNLLTMRVSLPLAKYETEQKRKANGTEWIHHAYQ